MKSKIYKIFVILLPLWLSAGCTQFNGYIGDLFGSWVLDGIEAEGGAVAPVLDADCDYFISFQTNIVFIETVGQYNTLQTTAATWAKTDGKMSFDFDHDDDEHSTYLYNCPAWFGPNVPELEWNIVQYTAKSLTLQRSADGGMLVYHFSKTL